jgi:cyclopropane-fatty-acyl-phospholipid synthase
MANVSSSSSDLVLDQTSILLERIFPSPRSFSIHLWSQAELPAEGKPLFILVLNHPGALRRMFSPPIELSACEAFIYGDFDFEGEMYDFYGLLDALADHNFTPGEAASLIKDIQRLPNTGPERQISRQPAKLTGKLHSRERDMQAIRFHYNVSNDFYALWLTS